MRYLALTGLHTFSAARRASGLSPSPTATKCSAMFSPAQIVCVAGTGYVSIEMVKACLRIRVDFEEGTILSPGKVRLLEMVEQCGSLEGAAASIEMDFDIAQLVVRQLEGLFGGLLVEPRDGSDARRVRLTELGRKVVERYRDTERVSALAADRHLAELTSLAPDRHGSDTGSV